MAQTPQIRTPTRAAIQTLRRPGRAIPTIDVHTHIDIPGVTEFQKAAARKPGTANQGWIGDTPKQAKGSRRRDMVPHLHDPKVRLAAMDRQGIDIQVVSMNLYPSCYTAAAGTGRKVAQICNDGVAEFVSHDPNRFVGLASLPLQNIEFTLAEMDRAVHDLGLRGFEIASTIRNRDLGEPEFRPFWAKARELDLPVFIHPMGFTDPGRLKKFRLWNTIGQPLEEAIAMSSLIHEGIMEDYPGLKVVICHGGGYLPYYSGRGDHAYKVHTDMGDKMKYPPSHYMRKIYCDTVIFDRDMLPLLLRKVGAGRILMGSDYPFVLDDPVEFIWGARGISKEAKEKILWKNAAKLFRLRM